MKKQIRFLAVLILVVAAAVWGQNDSCNWPGILNPENVPFAYDSNGHQPISWMQIEEGSRYGCEIRACDPDGDVMLDEASSLTVKKLDQLPISAALILSLIHI